MGSVCGFRSVGSYSRSGREAGVQWEAGVPEAVLWSLGRVAGRQERKIAGGYMGRRDGRKVERCEGGKVGRLAHQSAY